MGSIYRRSDTRHKKKVWWVSYMVGGRQHRESTGFTNKKMAERLLALRTAQILEERWNIPRSSTPRLGTQAEEFLASMTHAKTRSRYQSSINNLLRYFGENIRLSDITPVSICRFQRKRLAEGAGKATINRDVAALSALMSDAKEIGLISHNRCLDVSKLNEKRDRRQAEPFSYEEEARVKQFCPQVIDAPPRQACFSDGHPPRCFVVRDVRASDSRTRKNVRREIRA